MLSHIKKALFNVTFLFIALALFPRTSISTPPDQVLEPVWERINGEWKFKKTDKQIYENLVYVTTTMKNNQNENILTKDMVKLPFVLIIRGNSDKGVLLQRK
jgi:hypothetical protein|tara:strand:+ start:638 stop:943 length:306 start_codon:yes stop_codon:yes gene_type:complete